MVGDAVSLKVELLRKFEHSADPGSWISPKFNTPIFNTPLLLCDNSVLPSLPLQSLFIEDSLT